MEKLHIVGLNTQQRVQYGSQNNLNNRSQSWALCVRYTHAQLSNTYRTKTLLRTTWKK